MHEPCQKRYTWITNFLLKTERFNTQDWRAHIHFLYHCIFFFVHLFTFTLFEFSN